MVFAKFPIQRGPAWELCLKPSHYERRPVSDEIYLGSDNNERCAKTKTETKSSAKHYF